MSSPQISQFQISIISLKLIGMYREIVYIASAYNRGTGVLRDRAKAPKFTIFGVNRAFLDPSQFFVIFPKKHCFQCQFTNKQTRTSQKFIVITHQLKQMTYKASRCGKSMVL